MDNGIDIHTTCAQCGTPGITTTMEQEHFLYGIDGPGQVVLTATVPVRRCAACGFDYTDDEGEDARQDTVDDYLAAHPEVRHATHRVTFFLRGGMESTARTIVTNDIHPDDAHVTRALQRQHGLKATHIAAKERTTWKPVG